MRPYPPAWPGQQPPKRSFWWTGAGAWAAVGIGVGGVAVLAVAAIVVLSSVRGPASTGSGSSMDVKLVSCEFRGGPLASVTVGYTVTNTGDRAGDAAVRFEYRDAAGRRVDTDSGYVRSISPGDTVRSEELTLLDAEVSSGQCRIVGVD